MRRPPFLPALTLLALARALAPAADDLGPRALDAGGRCELAVVDHLKDPRFAWPESLLSFPIDCRAATLTAADLRVTDDAGTAVPFQLADVIERDGRLERATVLLLSNLPSGASRRWVVRAAAVTDPAPSTPALRVEAGDTSLTIDNGTLKLRLPASRTLAPGETVPGPLLAIDRGWGWIGSSVFTVADQKHAVTSITTTVLESGPLRTVVRLDYACDGDARYRAEVCVVAGQDFATLRETMTGFGIGEPAARNGGAWDLAWEGFHPTHRNATGTPGGGVHRIDEPLTMAYRGEDPAFTGPSRIEDPAVDMVPSLIANSCHSHGGQREAGFWDERNGQAVGLFIDDVARWQDHRYASWTSHDVLTVHYRHADGVLHWRWPLADGTRSAGIGAYHVTAKTPAAEPAATGEDGESPLAGGSGNDGFNHHRWWRTWYGDLRLDRLKEWDLGYTGPGPREPWPGPEKSVKKADNAAFLKFIGGCSISALARGSYHPVSLRDIGGTFVPQFHALNEHLPDGTRERATALLSLAAYVSSSEEYAPIRTMLGGHPNFMGDYKFPLMGAAWLFPAHRDAAEWRDAFEAFARQIACFHTRPAVAAWGTRGGRWTESIATYNGAFLHPALLADRLGVLSDGRERLANPWIALHASYLVGILTAPVVADAAQEVPAGTALTPDNGFKRLHPPQGAHSSRRVDANLLHDLGEALRRYRPLLAEHLLWAAAEARGAAVPPAERGTPPDLDSASYTGYGHVLRAGVGTAAEVSVVLQQIDKGPNYRWGFANEGGCGDIYYYGGGRSWSGHLREDAGDRRVADAELSCNTGIYKDGAFRTIGMNDLTVPITDLEVAQQAVITSRSGSDAYAWPEYRSRSVTLVGSDYILTHDATAGDTSSRFSWAAGSDDRMPGIFTVAGGAAWPTTLTTREGEKATATAVWYQAHPYGGDRIMLVSHRPEVSLVAAPRAAKGGGARPWPTALVLTPEGEDHVFLAATPIAFDGDGVGFRGTAGVVRQRTAGPTELALLRGGRISGGGVTLTVEDAASGASAVVRPDRVEGWWFSPGGATFSISASAGALLYCDGAAVPVQRSDDGLAATLPAGRHRWELTGGTAAPGRAQIQQVVNRPGGATVTFSAAAGATGYRLEVSADGCRTWQTAAACDGTTATLTGLPVDTRQHLRVVALRRERAGQPSAAYPLEARSSAPRPPDGLAVELADGEARLSWGEVLGAEEYRLYRRVRGSEGWSKIARGAATAFTDRDPVIEACREEPGRVANSGRALPAVVYEYAVTAVDGAGEGPRSSIADSDPTRWRNWRPPVPMQFDRRSGFWLPPYVRPDQVPPQRYP